jgi:hypothetical protein
MLSIFEKESLCAAADWAVIYNHVLVFGAVL